MGPLSHRQTLRRGLSLVYTPRWQFWLQSRPFHRNTPPMGSSTPLSVPILKTKAFIQITSTAGASCIRNYSVSLKEPTSTHKRHYSSRSPDDSNDINEDIDYTLDRHNFTSSDEIPSNEAPQKPYKGAISSIYNENILLKDPSELANAPTEPERDQEVLKVYNAFHKYTSVGNTLPDPEKIRLATKIWQNVFSKSQNQSSKLLALQKLIGQSKNRYISLLARNFRHDLYLQHIKLLYPEYLVLNRTKPSLEEIMLREMQLNISPSGSYSLSEHSAIDFIKSPSISIEKKRQVVVTTLRYFILYAPEESWDFITERFLIFIESISPSIVDENGRDVSEFDVFVAPPSSAHHQKIYNHALQYLLSHKNLFFIKDYFEGLGRKNDYIRLLNALRDALNNVGLRRRTVDIWKEKVSLAEQNEPFTESLKVMEPLDLTVTMQVLFDMRLIKETLELYRKWSDLHEDAQISILLRIAQKERNWAILQEQFESMYGRGDLPHTIHYAIVMNALSDIGAKDETLALFKQLLERKLTPSKLVLSAVFNCHLHFEDYKKAFDFQTKYMKDDDQEFIHYLIYNHCRKYSNLDLALEWFEKAENEFNLTGTNVFSAKSILNLLKMTREAYDVSFYLRVFEMAKRTNTLGISIYLEMIIGCSYLGLFELGKQIVKEAHTNIVHPQIIGQLYSAELNNLIKESRYLTSGAQDHKIYLDMEGVIKRFQANHILPTASWYANLIKYHFVRNRFYDRGEARKLILLLETDTTKPSPDELHFEPFLRYYNSLKSAAGATKVLEIFKHMNQNNVAVSMRSYRHLMDALLLLDKVNSTNFANSTNLLKAIYETVDFQLPLPDQGEQKEKKKASLEEVLKAAKSLGVLTTKYIKEARDTHMNGEQLLFAYLNQLSNVGGKSVLNGFLYSIYQDVLPYFLTKQTDFDKNALIDRVFDELKTKILKFIEAIPKEFEYHEVVLPLYLNNNFAFYIGEKIAEMNPNNLSDEDLNVLRSVNNYPVRLNGELLNQVANYFLNVNDEGCLEDCLAVCENHLVQGNLVYLAKNAAKIRLLKLLMLHELNFISVFRAKSSFKLLFEQHHLDVLSVIEEFGQGFISRASYALEQEIKKYNKNFSKSRPLTIKILVRDKNRFFLPEFAVQRANDIGFNLLVRIIKHMKRYLSLHRIETLTLAIKYPRTFEVLLQTAENQYKEREFMKRVDKIEPVNGKVRETFKSKRDRIYQAFESVKPNIRRKLEEF